MKVSVFKSTGCCVSIIFLSVSQRELSIVNCLSISIIFQGFFAKIRQRAVVTARIAARAKNREWRETWAARNKGATNFFPSLGCALVNRNAARIAPFPILKRIPATTLKEKQNCPQRLTKFIFFKRTEVAPSCSALLTRRWSRGRRA